MHFGIVLVYLPGFFFCFCCFVLLLLFFVGLFGLVWFEVVWVFLGDSILFCCCCLFVVVVR